ncbi:MAG: hypothetical protein SOR31_05220 [Parvimonas sp.]|uniref:hypothetical protein n=1 Tax=Parvimonas sp. TaxID=1944660 RepID=UPI002A766B55|nr:hypothetical protein [Parvimonas sp.]MDY3051002.1 hypothetical protein [Parvimonas sp.]
MNKKKIISAVCLATMISVVSVKSNSVFDNKIVAEESDVEKNENLKKHLDEYNKHVEDIKNKINNLILKENDKKELLEKINQEQKNKQEILKNPAFTDKVEDALKKEKENIDNIFKNFLENFSLQNKKNTAKDIINDAKYLSEEDKVDFKNKIDNAKLKDNIDDILTKALDKDFENEKISLQNYKNAAKDVINDSKYLSDDDKNEAKDKIDNAKSKDEVDNITLPFLEKNLDNAKLSLKNYKDAAKDVINDAKYLSDEDKNEAKDKIDNAKSKDEVDDITLPFLEKNLDNSEKENKVEENKTEKFDEPKNYEKDKVLDENIKNEPNKLDDSELSKNENKKEIKDETLKAITKDAENKTNNEKNETNNSETSISDEDKDKGEDKDNFTDNKIEVYAIKNSEKKEKLPKTAVSSTFFNLSAMVIATVGAVISAGKKYK